MLPFRRRANGNFPVDPAVADEITVDIPLDQMTMGIHRTVVERQANMGVSLQGGRPRHEGVELGLELLNF